MREYLTVFGMVACMLVIASTGAYIVCCFVEGRGNGSHPPPVINARRFMWLFWGSARTRRLEYFVRAFACFVVACWGLGMWPPMKQVGLGVPQVGRRELRGLVFTNAFGSNAVSVKKGDFLHEAYEN